MATRDETEKRLHAIAALRTRLTRRAAHGGSVRVSCPACGTSLLVVPGQQRGLCFGCSQAVDMRLALRNTYARAAREGVRDYQELLSLADEQIRLGFFGPAEEMYTQCLAADPESGAAWRGLLLAVTENWQREMEPPQGLFERACRFLPGPETDRLSCQWSLYTEHIRQKENGRRQREQARSEYARRTQQAENSGKSRRFPARAFARALITMAALAGMICLMFTGTSFMFILGACILASLGRRHGDDGE